MKVLHVAAEAFPLIKTGGLADVMAGLPAAQAALGADVRLLLPGLPAVIAGVAELGLVADIGPTLGALRVRLLLGHMPGSGLKVYVIDAPYLYRRQGGPYDDKHGKSWPDNTQRFTLLGKLAAHLAAGELDDNWSPDIVHAHDWHAALAPAFMAGHGGMEARSVFTVHNLAFQGLSPLADAALLGLPGHQLSAAGMEFHGRLNFLKAGLVFADHVTTVSPRYAQEITTPEHGCGLEGVLRGLGSRLTGVLNGIDTAQWNPASDTAIAQTYDAATLRGKAVNKRALQTELGLTADESAMLLTVVSRLTSQKGLDLLLQSMPALLQSGMQFAVQGTGDAVLEAAFKAMQTAHPEQVSVLIGYDEARAHRLIAGADVIALPSRFEPCGLTQLYGQRYGTLPIVRAVGGLADSVTDASAAALAAGRASGFCFDLATPAAFEQAAGRAQKAWRDKVAWERLVVSAMAIDRGWIGAAQTYLSIYHNVWSLAEPVAND